MAEDEVPQEENQTKKDSWTDRRSDKEAYTIRHAASEVSRIPLIQQCFFISIIIIIMFFLKLSMELPKSLARGLRPLEDWHNWKELTCQCENLTFRVMFMFSFIWGFIYFCNVCYNVLQCVTWCSPHWAFPVWGDATPNECRCWADTSNVLSALSGDICIKQERGWKG